MKKKETLFDILLKVSELRMDIETAEKRILRLLDVVGQSEQLVCPNCKGKNIEIRHREQSFRCIDCKEGWAN